MKHKQPLRTILLAAHSAKQGWGLRGVQEVSHLLLLLRQDRAHLVHLWKTFFLSFGCSSALRRHFVYIQTGSL